jgi:hypothetical protein
MQRRKFHKLQGFLIFQHVEVKALSEQQQRGSSKEFGFSSAEWLREQSIAHFKRRSGGDGVGCQGAVNVVQGFRRLKENASTAWLYAIGHIHGLRMKEPPGSSQQCC